MDVKRNLLLVALAVVSYLILLTWNKDFPAKNVVAEQSVVTINQQSNNLPTIPAINTETTSDLPLAQNQKVAVTTSPTNSSLIVINTPLQIVTLDLLGGDIVNVSLRKFPISLDRADEPFTLLKNDSTGVYVARSGLVGTNGPDANSDGRPKYRSTQTQYSVAEGELSVDLITSDINNVVITKRYIFNASDYLIKLNFLIDNKTGSPWQANLFGQIKRDRSVDPSIVSGFGVKKTYLGAVLTSQKDPYQKLKFDDIDQIIEPIKTIGGWIGFSQHYFLGSWIPPQTAVNTFSVRNNSNNEYLLGFVSPETVVQGGESAVIEAAFWAGPKDQYRLEAIAPNLGLTIDYGKLWYFAYPVFWLLSQINDLVGNYGLSIILLTVIIRLLFYPLSAKQYKSQANMKRLQPKINQLKERYGEDKQKFMQAQMELWKKEKVNPFGGCLPVLLQMPVFLGIYWVLNESVELRQATFILWYQDLSAMDDYFVLPILLGAAYYLQQHLTPMMTTDPMQAKMMKFMPVIFSVFFLFFPAGLVLYYLVNAVLGILQQWYFTNKVESLNAANNG